MLPSLVTQFIILVKDTSLASIIGYMDLTKAAQTVNQREIRPFSSTCSSRSSTGCCATGCRSGAGPSNAGWVARRVPKRDHRVRERGTGRRPRPRSVWRDSGAGFAAGLVVGSAGCTGTLREDMVDRTPPCPTCEGESMGCVRISVGYRRRSPGCAVIESGLGSAAAARGRRKREPGKTRRRWPAICRPRSGGSRSWPTASRGWRLPSPPWPSSSPGWRRGASSVAAVPRAGPPEPARGTLHLGRGALRSGDGKLRAGSSDRQCWTSRSSRTSTRGTRSRPAPSSGSGKPTSSRDFEQAANKYQKAIDLAAIGSEPPTRCSARSRAPRSAARTGHGGVGRLVRDLPGRRGGPPRPCIAATAEPRGPPGGASMAASPTKMPINTDESCHPTPSTGRPFP